MANEDKLRFSRNSGKFNTLRKTTEQSNKLEINRYNLSVHNQQLLKEAITPTKSQLYDINQMIKFDGIHSDIGHLQQNELLKTL